MSLLVSWLASPAPDAAIEIAPEAVSVAVLGTRGSEPVVQAYGSAPLPTAAIVPSLAGQNIADRTAVANAMRVALERAGLRPKRVALVVPDLIARVSLVRFDQIPSRREDLDQLIRWQVKKSLPFPPEEACISYSPGVRTGTGGEFIVVTARRDSIREYESLCDEAGMHAGVVDLSTLSLANLHLAGTTAPTGDWLIVHMRPEYTSIAIVRGGDLIFFRNRPEGDQEALSDVVHQTAMYYQDRLDGQGFARVLISGVSRTPGGLQAARAELEGRLGHAVEVLDPTRTAPLTDRASVMPDQRALLAPLVGMLLRTRREVARA